MQAPDITTAQEVDFTLTPTTVSGKPAKVDGAPTYTVSSGSVTLRTAPDGLSTVIVSGDVEEAYTVDVSADADVGAGVETISMQITGNVLGEKAAQLGGTFGAPGAKQ